MRFIEIRLSTLYLHILCVLFCVGAVFLLSGTSSAQQLYPTIIFSWSADTYTPTGYEGKALPIFDSTIRVSADIVFDNRIQDLSNATFRWFVGGNLYASGRGKQAFDFQTRLGVGNNNRVRLEIDYNGQTYEKNFFIPVRRPQVVLVQSNSYKNIVSGSNLFYALPYFFNTKNLGDIFFSWQVNGQEVAGNDAAEQSQLSLNVPEGTQEGTGIFISLFTQNSSNKTEFVSEDIIVTVKNK